MKLSDFSYRLPEELIAAIPASPRDHSRLLVVDRRNGRLEHRRFFNIIDYLQKGDVLVVNDSKVIPARLLGKKASGGAVEIFLSKPVPAAKGRRLPSETWECLIKGKHMLPGTRIDFSKTFFAVVGDKAGDTWSVTFNRRGTAFRAALLRYGQTPLPPYIKADPKKAASRYQTVYADAAHAGSVAAPTAGLHFTPRLLAALKNKGIILQKITLHVGLGTFLPVRVDDIRKHRMHGEWVEVSAAAKRTINAARAKGRRVIAVGTTSVRSLEAAFAASPDQAFKGSVDIFIYPPYRFKAVDGLITNFHLPESTLLMLVSAFASPAIIKKAYAAAIKERYRFYSFGDAMLLI